MKTLTILAALGAGLCSGQAGASTPKQEICGTLKTNRTLTIFERVLDVSAFRGSQAERFMEAFEGPSSRVCIIGFEADGSVLARFIREVGND